MTFTTTATHILRNGHPFAIATTEEGARQIADMMNLPDHLDARAERMASARGPARMMRALASDLRAGLVGGDGE